MQFLDDRLQRCLAQYTSASVATHLKLVKAFRPCGLVRFPPQDVAIVKVIVKNITSLLQIGLFFRTVICHSCHSLDCTEGASTYLKGYKVSKIQTG